MFIFYRCFIVTIALLILSTAAYACESCLITRMGKDKSARTESSDQKWYTEYVFEQKNYDRMDAREAHTLHHNGAHVHDKITEDFHHFVIGRKLTDDLSVDLEMPYVIRRSLEVDSHANLGKKQRSEGLGDLTLLGRYCLWTKDNQSLGAAAGVKFPTGYTGEMTTSGAKFEAEMQPGTGSWDYIIGSFYKNTLGRFNVMGNLSYVLKTEGAYDMQFGNSLTASGLVDYLINPSWDKFQTKAGVDVVYQNDWQDRERGEKMPDSGGVRILTGPVFSVSPLPETVIDASLLFPAYQQLGGVHQELDYVWTLAAKVAF